MDYKDFARRVPPPYAVAANEGSALSLSDGHGSFIIGGPVLVIERDDPGPRFKVTRSIISSVTRAGCLHLRGSDRRRFQLERGCAAARERMTRTEFRDAAWIVPDTPMNRQRYGTPLVEVSPERTNRLGSAASSVAEPAPLMEAIAS